MGLPKRHFPPPETAVRGVFRVTVLKSVLDRLMYNDMYHIIDENLTDGNVEAHKNRNITQ